MNSSAINYDLILSQCSVILEDNKIEVLDIGIKNGKIFDIGDLSKSVTKEKLDLNNLIVMPGAIDTQVHFREPGLTHKEDIYHGTKAAIIGGITSIFEMPNTIPATTNKTQLLRKLKIAEKNAFCNYSFFIGATKNNFKQLSNLELLKG